jgi:hypothetical protein
LPAIQWLPFPSDCHPPRGRGGLVLTRVCFRACLVPSYSLLSQCMVCHKMWLKMLKPKVGKKTSL